ncbi:MAG: hypothetical protein CVV64_07885 [Candidatus Wallbacteria bacterium HGW-Wallbacteria-1]|jgi:hypothetical protein|uniref:Glycosyltransferase 2-like domain-containing protein n=1 Tax=Candidatus Wallbacteria bacterium HGW-Wallbacteria-1 TaxID=2013854 RepID=A0A2N1PR22_9BACT|nr:MAG: hypothetical protein CVV64_07885 [Candidatus Wallbacteria bacterium HGW-Wallbacteria-1]
MNGETDFHGMEKSPNGIAAVIVNFNKRDLLRECILSLKKMHRQPDWVFVVDNGSSDGSADMVRQEFFDVTLVAMEENTGGAGGFNSGMKAALETSCEFIYIMDNDVELHQDCLGELEKALLNEPSAAMAGSKVFYHSRKNIIWEAGCGFNWILQTRIHRGDGKPDTGQYDEIESVDYMPATTLLVRREAIRIAGLMDSSFFIYMDDADWCFRMAAMGWKILYVPDSVAWHHFTSGMPSPFSVYYSTRNSLKIFQKHCHPHFLPLVYIMSIIKNMARLIVFSVKRNLAGLGENRAFIQAFADAYRDYFSNRMGRNSKY